MSIEEVRALIDAGEVTRATELLQTMVGVDADDWEQIASCREDVGLPSVDAWQRCLELGGRCWSSLAHAVDFEEDDLKRAAEIAKAGWVEKDEDASRYFALALVGLAYRSPRRVKKVLFEDARTVASPYAEDGVPWALSILGNVAAADHEVDEAAKYYRAAIDNSEQIDPIDVKLLVELLEFWRRDEAADAVRREFAQYLE